MIKPCKLNQNGGRNVIFACFVFGIARLRHAQHLGDLGLVEVFIFAQVTDAVVFHIASKTDGVARPLYFNLFQGIDI